MKIGQVVREFGIPVNSLYFYINNGLLVPPKKNNQYIFDERTIADIQWILELKELDFPLKTIHRLLSLRRISNLCTEADINELKSIYREQAETLKAKEAKLSRARRILQDKLAALEQREFSRADSGVPLVMLPLLCCPHCGGELMLDHVSMSQKYVFHADLSCACGYEAAIRNGILETKNKNTSLYDKPDTTQELYRDLPSKTLSLFEQSYHWMEERITSDGGSEHVWLESYVTAWFFLHNHLHLLHKNDSLIVVDKFPETLQAYKKVIEEQGVPCPILYIADASMQPPVKKHCIDRSMDFFASNEHSFYHDNFYLDQMHSYLRSDCRLYGVYFFFHKAPKSMHKYLSMYPGASEHNFNIHWFEEALERHYKVVEMADCGYSLDSGDNLGLGFHVPGEELHLEAYEAKLK
ncbi:MAG: MerR family transcriptional regulator [Acidaminococcus sp.]|jgi:DNA-binding transcriptional MerR regulator|nr:MerR family transcriptional regulator [Acidaminococcus sp.]MCI2117070.1 MerR family transcriptional regulator [Acidaminococcus sp.]